MTLLYNLGIPVDRTVRVDFAGFKGIVDIQGGVDIPAHCRLEDYWPYPDEMRQLVDFTAAGKRYVSGPDGSSTATRFDFACMLRYNPIAGDGSNPGVRFAEGVEKSMNSKTTTLRVARDGTLTIPGHIIDELRLAPDQTITVEIREDTLVLIPPREARLSRIGDLLRTALAGVEWTDVEAGRSDRCF